MECPKVKSLLSAYLADNLDGDAAAEVEKHLRTCEGCSREMARMKKMIAELQAVKPIKAPPDFLHRIHSRKNRKSVWQHFFQTLFIPVRFKLPIQIIATAVIAVLVFQVVTEEEIKKAPLKSFSEPERSSESEREMFLKEERDSESGEVKDTARPLAAPSITAKKSVEKGPEHRLSLTLFPEKGKLRTEPLSPALRYEGSPEIGKKGRRTFGPGGKAETTYRPGKWRDRIEKMITAFGGKITAQSFPNSDRMQFQFQIPAKNYKNLYHELESIGNFQTSPADFKKMPDKNLQVVLDISFQ